MLNPNQLWRGRKLFRSRKRPEGLKKLRERRKRARKYELSLVIVNDSQPLQSSNSLLLFPGDLVKAYSEIFVSLPTELICITAEIAVHTPPLFLREWIPSYCDGCDCIWESLNESDDSDVMWKRLSCHR